MKEVEQQGVESKHSPHDWHIVDARRRQVAALRLRGITIREIRDTLTKMRMVNPTTGQPWSVGTVQEDLNALHAEWRAEASKDTAELKSNLLAELREVRRAAWGDKKQIHVVLKALAQEAKLLGLDAPLKIDMPGAGVNVKLEGLNVDELAQLDQLLAKLSGAGTAGPESASPAGAGAIGAGEPQSP